jgi:hypothetical protein
MNMTQVRFQITFEKLKEIIHFSDRKSQFSDFYFDTPTFEFLKMKSFLISRVYPNYTIKWFFRNFDDNKPKQIQNIDEIIKCIGYDVKELSMKCLSEKNIFPIAYLQTDRYHFKSHLHIDIVDLSSKTQPKTVFGFFGKYDGISLPKVGKDEVEDILESLLEINSGQTIRSKILEHLYIHRNAMYSEMNLSQLFNISNESVCLYYPTSKSDDIFHFFTEGEETEGNTFLDSTFLDSTSLDNTV